MKILHINASDIGSTGKIVQDISRLAVTDGWDAVSLFPKRNRTPDPCIREYMTSLPLEQGIYRRICRVFGHQYGLAPISTVRIRRILHKEKPDVVHLHSINGHCVNIYQLLAYLKKNRIPTVVTNHAEFFYTGNCSHAFFCEEWKNGCHRCKKRQQATGCRFFGKPHTAWKKMKHAFAGHSNVHIVSVSPWSYNRSSSAPILEGLPQSTILNGVNCKVFFYRDQRNAREALGLSSEERIVLHVTSNFTDYLQDNKGGRYLIELAERFRNKKVRFLVAGRHSISEPLPENITLLGRISDQDLLATYYAAADLTVLVSQRETFGMAVAESLCCGTPVVGFESGGSESVALQSCSEFVPFGDVQALERIMDSCWLKYKTTEAAEQLSRIAVETYRSERMARQYIDLYHAMVEMDKVRNGWKR